MLAMACSPERDGWGDKGKSPHTLPRFWNPGNYCLGWFLVGLNDPGKSHFQEYRVAV